MKDLGVEFEFYKEGLDELVDDETWDYYHDELVEIRDKTNRIVIAWVVPDEDDGHVEYKEFDTWTDAGIWMNQK